jgi:hypothetical protein
LALAIAVSGDFAEGFFGANTAVEGLDDEAGEGAVLSIVDAPVYLVDCLICHFTGGFLLIFEKRDS